jgi:outer membrane protein assembly factor BamE (lipoprotein component of BamABCDE complex)
MLWAIALSLAIPVAACKDPAMSFDRAAWASGQGNASGKNPRSGMVSQARDAGLKVGATRAEVRALLGEPDASDSGGDAWFLGQGQYSVDFETLDVSYGSDGRVTAIEQKRK